MRIKRLPAVWAWIFPILAAAATGWLFWNNWRSEGPLIEIRFSKAPGIQAGKTQLIYRGVNSGTVASVQLDNDLDEVIVRVRLKAFAEPLAREQTDFWIDQPVISLKETSGLEAIIQGNSIQARLGGGPAAYTFKGLDQAPLDPLEAPSLVLDLYADNAPFLDRGTPVYHKGVQAGVVRTKTLDDKGRPRLEIVIDEAHAGLMRDTARFWILPATSLRLTPHGANLSIPGLDALVTGGIAFDHFVPDGGPVRDGTKFYLAANEFAARADGPPIEIVFDDGRGLIPGDTQLTWLGQPVGLVTDVRVDPDGGTVTAVARLQNAFTGLARGGTTFTLVRPRISLAGVSGLETLVTGSYLAVEPGTGEPGKRFAGRSISQEQWDLAKEETDGIEITLSAQDVQAVPKGAPVLYKGLLAGTVRGQGLDNEGRPVLRVVVHGAFRDKLRSNSRFWQVAAAEVSAGPGVLDFKVAGLQALLQGAVAFETFGSAGSAAEPGATFRLHANRSLASATSAPIRITFANVRGLLPGKTQLRYLGFPVGIVESVRVRDGAVDVVAHVEPGYDFLRRSGSRFQIVQPQLTLQGLTGLETVLSGVYIECVPGPGPGFAETFKGRTTSQPEVLEVEGFPVVLRTNATRISPGARVYFRDIPVGEVTARHLSGDGRMVELTAKIAPKYRHLVRENSSFWDSSDIGVAIGFITVRVSAPSLLDPNGRISFANPAREAAPATAGVEFPLLRRPPPGMAR